MESIKLGRTGLMVSRCGFGALPIQRVDFDEANSIITKAYKNGINFFDTARAYTDSEEKIGLSLSEVRADIFLATKSKSTNKTGVLKDLEISLDKLKTKSVELLQLHNPQGLPDVEDKESAYAGLVEAKNRGFTRFIGITNHKIDLAKEAASSDLYDTVQYPLSSLSSDNELELIDICRNNDIGLIAMKALSGGLITNVASTFAFLRQYDNVLPIWGIEKEWQLDEFLGLEKIPPLLDESLWEVINKDRSDLSGSFCRGCGYCLPCPVGILINMAARMALLLKRSARKSFINEEWKNKMALINDCQECGHCKDNCPYGLDTPAILKIMLVEYEAEYTKG